MLSPNDVKCSSNSGADKNMTSANPPVAKNSTLDDRAQRVTPALINALDLSDQSHFEAFCKGNIICMLIPSYHYRKNTRKQRRHDQMLPTKVWEKIQKYISVEFFEEGNLSDRRGSFKRI